MRLDVYGKVSRIVKDEIKPNFAAIARQMGCDYRTAKRHYEQSLLTQSGKQVAHAPTTQRVALWKNISHSFKTRWSGLTRRR